MASTNSLSDTQKEKEKWLQEKWEYDEENGLRYTAHYSSIYDQ